jgi:hypothetical protein
MPARITVKAELQSLLNKSQALTDANRLQQLETERRRREEVAQLAAKRRKEQEEARRRKEPEDRAGRNRRTAAMGQLRTVTVGRGYTFNGPGVSYAWSGDGLQRHEFSPNAFNPFVFPIGGDRAIFSDITNNVAVYVDNTSLRIVTQPPTLTDTLTSAYRVDFGWAIRQTDPSENYDQISTPSVFFNVPALYPGLHPPPPVDNTAYSVMRPLVEPIAPGLKEVLIVTNDSSNGFVNNGEFLSVVSKTGYEWNAPDPADDESPNAPLTDPRWRRIGVKPPPPSFVPIIPSVPTSQTDIGPSATYFWDWGKPSYCYQQLIALGFLPEDLAPLPPP